MPRAPINCIHRTKHRRRIIGLAALTRFSPRRISVFAIVLVKGSRSCRTSNGFVAPHNCCKRVGVGASIKVNRSVVVHDFHAVRGRLGGGRVPLSGG